MAGAGLEKSPISYSEQEDFQREKTLGEEIFYLRSNWQKEGLPQNWTDLPGVGFMINHQVGFLSSEKLADLSTEERKRLWSDLTDYSLKSWVGEYPAQKAVLPGMHTISIEGGKPRMRDTLHGAGMEIGETISKKERNGVPWHVNVNVVNPFLFSAPNGSMAVVDSPHGCAMEGEDGKPIIYKDSRLTMSVKEGEKVYIYTIPNDFSYKEHRELIKRFRFYAGMPPAKLFENSPVEDYVASPALFNNSEMHLKVKDVIQVMRQVREDLAEKSEKIKSRYIFKDRTFDDTLSDAKSWDALWRYDETTDRFIHEFRNFSLYQNWTYEDLKEALATTILRLSRHVLKKEKEKKLQRINGLSNTVEIAFYDSKLSQLGYGRTFIEVRAIPGCAGGGRGENGNSFSSQFDKLFKSLFGDEWFECPKCNYKADGPVGDTCPGCGLTKEKYAKESKEPICA